MISKTIRTALQSTTSTEALIDVGILSEHENILGLTITNISGENFISGQQGDDFVPLGAGLALDIDFPRTKTSKIPRIKATTTGQVGIVFSITGR